MNGDDQWNSSRRDQQLIDYKWSQTCCSSFVFNHLINSIVKGVRTDLRRISDLFFLFTLLSNRITNESQHSIWFNFSNESEETKSNQPNECVVRLSTINIFDQISFIGKISSSSSSSSSSASSWLRRTFFNISRHWSELSVTFIHNKTSNVSSDVFFNTSP